MRHLLVSDPGPDGESQTVLLCDLHLVESLKLAPLGRGEYVLDADEDCDCDECAARAR